MNLRVSIVSGLLALCLCPPLRAQQSSPRNLVTGNLLNIDATAPIPAVEMGFLHLGGISASGHSLQVNSRYLTLNGKPWLPVMGEVHYTRIPEEDWEAEILKVKAGGVNIISTYVFWIHHEEVEGHFDWSGRRNLRHFVELCAKHGMYVYLRPGPWAHGEARNGGFPDWLNTLPNIRTNDPVYLNYVSRFFGQIGQQLKGLMWKDGGPIIGSQLENEYPFHGPGRGAEHILRLKQLAIAAGIDPPLFSVTGWPSLDFPPQEVLPVSGGYPDGFWFGSQEALPPSMNYLFNFNRKLGDMGATVRSTDPTGKVDLRHDPYFAAEQAGGMATSYHRRPVLSADDIAAQALVGIGSGVNLYGYYMYRGGTNPPGVLTTLQESQATGYPNDLPEIDYDFQAPIGAFGELRESYRKTRLLHLFLNAYGAQLAPMIATGPERQAEQPVGETEQPVEVAAADTSRARVAVRTDGKSGFLFVNNYVRQLSMPARAGFQVRIKLPESEVLLPRRPVFIPSGAYFLWPFNLAIEHAKLQYSTAQPLTRIETSLGPVSVFFSIPGIAPEFSFDAATIRSLDAPGARVLRTRGKWSVDRLKPGLQSTIRITDAKGTAFTILLLTKDEAEHCSIVRSGGQDVLALTQSDIFQDGNEIHLRSTLSPEQQVRLLPGVKLPSPALTAHTDGLWTQYAVSQPMREFHLTVTPVQNALPRGPMSMGPPVAWRTAPVPQAPEDTAFRDAAVWNLHVSSAGPRSTASEPQATRAMAGLSELYLGIPFTGDIAHLQSGTALVDDDFFNGQPWQIGLKHLPNAGSDGSFTLSILPMPKDAPIYLDEQAHRLLQRHPSEALLGATLTPEYESVIMLGVEPSH